MKQQVKTKSERIQEYVNKHNTVLDKKIKKIKLVKPIWFKVCNYCKGTIKGFYMFKTVKHLGGDLGRSVFYACKKCAPTVEDAHKLFYENDYLSVDTISEDCLFHCK